MKTKKTILVASSSMLAAGMAQGAIVYHSVNQSVTTGDPIKIDLNLDGTDDFQVFFDAFQYGSAKPCIQEISKTSNPSAWVFNQMVMGNNNNGLPVIPFGTTITNQFTVGDYTVSPSLDSEGNRRGYLYQSETKVGEWPTASGSDTTGYVALALVDNNLGTTNYGWVQIELSYNPTATLRVIDCAYESVPGASIDAGKAETFPIPKFFQTPTSQTVSAGVTVTMNSFALGDPAPTYQWKAGAVGSGIYTNVPNAGIFSGADTPKLTISNVVPVIRLDYVVVASNINGSTTSSPPATLTVNNPELTPSQQAIYAGYPAKFTVPNLGGVETTYRWQRNGTDLVDGGVFSGVTTTSLQISGVNPTTAGDYRVIANTAYGAVTSSVAPLSMTNPDGSVYEAYVRANGAVNYYRLNEISGTNAWDFIGGKNGNYAITATLGAAGPIPATFPGFVSTNYTASFQANGDIDPNAYISLPPWNLNTNTVTLTAWIYPTAKEGGQGLNSGILFTAAGDCGIRYDGGYGNTNGMPDSNIGYSWNGDNTYYTGITAPHNEWSLVALTVSPTDATLYIVNDSYGLQYSVNTNNQHAPILFNGTEYIGTYPLEQKFGDDNFVGYIDEVAIFKSTLSSNQIYSLYGCAKGVQPPATPVSYSKVGNTIQLQWTFGTLMQATNILGPWVPNLTATSPYIVNPTNAQTYFRTQ